MLVAGTITAPALLELYLERIARVDREVRAYRVVLTETARAEAEAAQERLDAGERLPLLGVPVAIKDDVDVADEFTCYGSSAHGLPPTADAEVVRRLREAGAVILGKTSVPEMMLWPFTETIAFGCHPQPVGSVPYARRQQRRQCGGGCRRPGADGAGLRRCRVDPHPVDLVRALRAQAAARPRVDGPAHRRLVRVECQRPDHPHRGGRRALPRRDQHPARPPRRLRGGRGPKAQAVANRVERQDPSDDGGPGGPRAAEGARRHGGAAARPRATSVVARPRLSGVGGVRPCAAPDVAWDP